MEQILDNSKILKTEKYQYWIAINLCLERQRFLDVYDYLDPVL